MVALEWICRYSDQVETAGQAMLTVDFFLEMHGIDANYTCTGRTPKTVSAALEAYVASTITFETDEDFQPNPRGLQPWFELGAMIPPETMVRVPYEGREELGGKRQPGSVAAAVRIAEVLSLRRLFYEGEKLYNCLERSSSSQAKYLSRARSRVSSFWSLTKQEAGGEVEHLCLIEVWHTQGGNEIRQAEGPRPRTIPSAEAWYWMERWCEREGVDLGTWDCYS